MLFWVAHPVGGSGFRPRGLQARSGSIPQRRANCEPAGPDVNEDRVRWPPPAQWLFTDIATDNRRCLQSEPAEQLQCMLQ